MFQPGSGGALLHADHLNPAVLRGRCCDAWEWLVETKALDVKSRTIRPIRHEIINHGLGAPPGQIKVVLSIADSIGMARYREPHALEHRQLQGIDKLLGLLLTGSSHLSRSANKANP
jgi:hypothetical protein